MLETFVRPYYQKIFVDPFLQKLKYLPAGFVTFLGLLSGILVLPALYFNQAGFACLLLIFSGYFDTLDGSLARIQEKTSPLGCMLDILADRTVEFSVIVGLLLVDADRGLSCVVMLGSILLCVTSFLVVGIFSTENSPGKSFYYSTGLIERCEAFIFFIAMIVFPRQFFWLSLVFSALVLLTAVIRLYQWYLLQRTLRHCS